YALLLSSCAVPHPEKGALISTWETNNNSFKIRVSEYVEKGAYLAGAYYVFESAAFNSDSWKPITTFRHDDQVGIQKEQVRFVDHRVGYVYMGWICAVTTDSGTSWTVWDATNDLPGWQCCNYGLIDGLNISLDGQGVMKLKPSPYRAGEVSEL